MQVQTDDPDGPPPPPFVRRRRRRRRMAIGAAVAVIAGVPLVLGVIGNDDTRVPQDEEATGDDPPVEDGGPQVEAPEDGDTFPQEHLPRPDAADLDGVDAVYAELLGDIDASELSMMGFQDALSQALSGTTDDADELTTAVQDAASTAQAELLEVRDRLADEVDDEGAEAVREAYVVHLDAWADFMAAVESDPGILASQDRTRVYNLAINVTADAFARTLDEELPIDVDAEVRRFADGILDRGFRDLGEADV